jgi:SAM-dependent methyltransferase
MGATTTGRFSRVFEDFSGPRRQDAGLPYDPTIYLGAARHYIRGRPAYSAELVATLARELGLDHGRRLLDMGCGPGVLALELASHFDKVIGLDPDAEMLAEGARRAAEAGVTNIRWIQSVAEDLPLLGLGELSVVTFGQSFHWTDQERVAEAVYDLLEPGGALVLVAHRFKGRPVPDGPGLPVIPHDDVKRLIRSYLGPRRRAGQGFVSPPTEPYEAVFARTRFGVPRIVWAPGRPDIVRDIDGVVSGFYSMSFAAPHLFGDGLAEFEVELRALLHAQAPDRLFWDWPGDTELVIAQKG